MESLRRAVRFGGDGWKSSDAGRQLGRAKSDAGAGRRRGVYARLPGKRRLLIIDKGCVSPFSSVRRMGGVRSPAVSCVALSRVRARVGDGAFTLDCRAIDDYRLSIKSVCPRFCFCPRFRAGLGHMMRQTGNDDAGEAGHDGAL
jgi:hypothetical protein